MTIVLASIREAQHHRGTVLNIATGEMKGVLRLAFLIPGWKIVGDHQRGLITDAEYVDGYRDRQTNQHIPGYRAILRSRWPAIAHWLTHLDAQEDLTLVCFCREHDAFGGSKFCHRQYIAKLLKRFRPDIDVVLH